MSKGAKQLLEIICKIYPNQLTILEHHIGERLMIDIYLPSLSMAFEYDGRQHKNYVEHFHGDKRGFGKAQLRDARKLELCEEQGITLISVAHDEPLTVDHIKQKIINIQG